MWQGDSGVPRLEGLLTHVRAVLWGQVLSLREAQKILNRSRHFVQSLGYDVRRDNWHLSPTCCVAMSMLMPIPVTTMNDVGGIPLFALHMAEHAV